MQSHHTISLIAQTTKIVARILRRRNERKMEDANRLLRIISEQTFDIDEELCACFIDR
jgi:hypothetical protein